MTTRAQANKGSNNGTKTIKDHFNQDATATKKVTIGTQENDNTKLLQEILTKLTNLTHEMTSVKQEISNMKTTVTNIVQEELTARDKIWFKDKEILLRKISDLERKEEAREKSDKRNNVIIKGYEVKSNLLTREMDEFFENKLGINVKTIDAFVIKTKNGGDLIKVKLAYFIHKQLIMGNKNKLKGSDIYIFNDRTLKERTAQKELAKIAEEEKDKGNNLKLGFMKITINGVTKTWNAGLGHFNQDLPSQPTFRDRCEE